MDSFVYILANKKNGTLYVGVTKDIGRRVYQHKVERYEGFSKRYGVKMLVYYEKFGCLTEAIAREKQMKKRKREWKIRMVESQNPEWKDLYHGEE